MCPLYCTDSPYVILGVVASIMTGLIPSGEGDAVTSPEIRFEAPFRDAEHSLRFEGVDPGEYHVQGTVRGGREGYCSGSTQG